MLWQGGTCRSGLETVGNRGVTHQRESSRVDWGLFLLIVAGAQGFYGFVPLTPGQSSLFFTGAILSFLVLRAPVGAINALLANPLILFMVVWIGIAALLSDNLGPSLYMAAVLTMMIAYLIQRQSTTEQTVRTFALATTASLVPSIIALVQPLGVPVRYGGSAGGYSGYFQWNSWSGACAAGVVLSVVALRIIGDSRSWHFAAGAGGLLMLVMSKSATAVVCFIGAVGVLAGIAAWQRANARSRPLVVVGVGIALLPTVLTLSNIDFLPTIAQATGRDNKLSRRTDIWQTAIEGISESPLFGYSSGFWNSNRIWSSAQNGFLDIALNGGVPAALALVAIVMLAGFRLAAASSPLLGFLAFGFLFNLSVTQIAIPTVPSLALWIAIASTARVAEESWREQAGPTPRATGGRASSRR